jgi:hypothetical protein
MALKLEVLGMRILEVMFFTGMIGCTACVIISWFSVGKGSFTDKN